MSRGNCQMQRWLVVVCTLFGACEGPYAGLLGDSVTSISVEQTAMLEPDAAVPPANDSGLPEPVASAPAPTSAPTAPTPTAPAPTIPPTPPSTPPAQPPVVQASLGKPDQVVVSDPVAFDGISSESYFCLAPDWQASEDTWIRALEVAPQHADHVFEARVSFNPEGVCDSLGLSVNSPVFDYRPDNDRVQFQQGDALLLPAQTRISVQVHYRKVGPSPASTDINPTELRLWTLPKGERPTREVARAQYQSFKIEVPINAVDLAVTDSAEIKAKYTRPGAEIIGMAPDMHYLGQTLKASLVAADGTSMNLLDLQDWTIEARKDYMFEPSQYRSVASGASFTQTCTYSNRPEDQALDASGNPMTPQLTNFGEDARQELCRSSVWFRYPL